MPQLQLPVFAQGMTLINANLGFVREQNSLTYFYGNLPVFTHDVDDVRSFRMITSQFYINGSAKQSEICRAFGVSPISVKRYVKLYRQNGIAGFFEPPRRRGAAVLTPDVLRAAHDLFDEGLETGEVAARLDLLADTLRKALQAGKLHKPLKKTARKPEVSSQRAAKASETP
ncbi:MAG TPA: helix-turn-helix domain-containing protein [Desulfobacteraceae bacterium]|nr:helix-turn-helix domain-containing protein [Desulfobacteraceae bacterium]